MYCEQNGSVVLLRIYTQPRASRTKIVGVHDGMLKISCCSPPVDGKANKELTTFLARILSCPKRDVEIVRGQSSRKKQFAISGLSMDDVRGCLEIYLSES